MAPRHFGFGFEREPEPVTIEDRFGGRWLIGAVVVVMLVLGGVGLYTFSSGHGPTIAMTPVDETLGRGTRPILPTLPH